MRILQINSLDSGGGASQMARALHLEYLNQGHDAHLLVGGKNTNTPNTHPLIKRQLFGKRLEAGLLHYLEYWTGYQGLFSHALRRWQRRHSRDWDIIHCHNLHGCGYVSFRDLEQLSPGTPMIVTLHDLWLLTGHCAYPMQSDGYKTGCGNCPQLKTYPQISVDKTRANARRKKEFVHKRTPTLIGVSEWTSQRVRESHLDWPCSTIYNGIDLEKFKPRSQADARSRLGLPQDCILALYVVAGGLMRSGPLSYKRPELVIDACKIVHERLKKDGIDFRLVTIGGESTGKDDRIPAFVSPKGKITNGIEKYYAAADVTLHASRADTFGLVLAESMACGTPVVTTDTGGCTELVASEDTGCIAPAARGAGAFADCVDRVLKNDADTARRECRQNAEKRFDQHRMIHEYLKLYKTIRVE